MFFIKWPMAQLPGLYYVSLGYLSYFVSATNFKYFGLRPPVQIYLNKFSVRNRSNLPMQKSLFLLKL